jgi:ABC-type arginine transport system ATPase subunit
MNKQPILQFAIVLIVGFSFWWKQTQINRLIKRCQRLEDEAEDTSQECEKQTKLLKATLQEVSDWRILHKAAIAERNQAHAELLMLRPQLQLSEKQRVRLTVENARLREAPEVSEIARWPIIASIPAQNPRDN